MRAVCVRHSKKLTIPTRQRAGDEQVTPECYIGDFHLNTDILVEPSILMYSNDKDPVYVKKLAEFEMFYQQAI